MAGNGPKHLVDSLEQRLTQLARYQPSAVVMELGPVRLDRVVTEFPGYIEYMQRVLSEAQQKQASRGRR